MNHKRALKRFICLLTGLVLWVAIAALICNYTPNSFFIALDAPTEGLKMLFSMLISLGVGMLMMFFSILLYSIMYDDHNGRHYMRMDPIPQKTQKKGK